MINPLTETKKRTNMSQQEVYDFLKAHKGKRYTCRQLSGKLKLSTNSTNMNCMILKISQRIKYERVFGKKRWETVYWV
jgi:hypothetical protein